MKLDKKLDQIFFWNIFICMKSQISRPFIKVWTFADCIIVYQTDLDFRIWIQLGSERFEFHIKKIFDKVVKLDFIFESIFENFYRFFFGFWNIFCTIRVFCQKKKSPRN